MTDSAQFFPNLESSRLHLRQLRDGDVDFIFRHFSNPFVTEYLMDESPVTELSEAQAIIDFYRDRDSMSRNRWGIVTKSDDQIIGTVGYHKWVKKYYRAEIGCDLSPSFWGQGIMSEAMRIAINHGFKTMGLNRIDALVYVENVRCLTLLRRLGFHEEGRLKDYFFLNDKFYDHYMFALMKRGWGG